MKFQRLVVSNIAASLFMQIILIQARVSESLWCYVSDIIMIFEKGSALSVASNIKWINKWINTWLEIERRLQNIAGET